MKPEELQIGDWVNVFDVPKQIEGIRTFKNGDEVAYYDGDNGNFIENLTPIPLTSEILEKNGFKKKVWWKHRKSDVTTYVIGDGFHIELSENEFWLVDNCSDDGDYGYESNGIVEIKYVHELQHVFKLFKIDKKIEL